ncbi:hypothetical protein Tco_0882574 [Tanacetum coccineum]
MYMKFPTTWSYLRCEGIKIDALSERDEESDLYVFMNGSNTPFQSRGLNMRKSRWMKLFSEYGFEAKYHLRKANVVVESWSRKKSEAKNEFWIDV